MCVSLTAFPISQKWGSLRPLGLSNHDKHYNSLHRCCCSGGNDDDYVDNTAKPLNTSYTCNTRAHFLVVNGIARILVRTWVLQTELSLLTIRQCNLMYTYVCMCVCVCVCVYIYIYTRVIIYITFLALLLIKNYVYLRKRNYSSTW